MTTTKRNADFSTTGEYTVTIGERQHTIYRDPENGWWYEQVSGKHFSQCVLGFTKKEAIQALEARVVANLVETVLATAPVSSWNLPAPAIGNALDELDEVIAKLEARTTTAAPTAGRNTMTQSDTTEAQAATITVDAVLWKSMKFLIEGLAIMGTVRLSHPALHGEVVKLARLTETVGGAR